MATTIHVTNISAATTDKEIRDFFSFCGKITDASVTAEGETKSATVTFERETAAKTALLLNNTQLGLKHISVTGAAAEKDEAGQPHERDGDNLTQEEKPRSRIFAEYLAHGYVVGDAALQKAIELDHTHGVSSRFLSTLQHLDQKYHATNRARSADTTYGITQRANSLLSGISSYYERATNTPTGKRIVDFYTKSQRQVADIHSEARRLADLKEHEHGSAYKAAGLEKVFGHRKTAASGKADPETTPATEATSTSPAPAHDGPATDASSAAAPKFEPPPTASS